MAEFKVGEEVRRLQAILRLIWHVEVGYDEMPDVARRAVEQSEVVMRQATADPRDAELAALRRKLAVAEGALEQIVALGHYADAKHAEAALADMRAIGGAEGATGE